MGRPQRVRRLGENTRRHRKHHARAQNDHLRHGKADILSGRRMEVMLPESSSKKSPHPRLQCRHILGLDLAN
jgi:hypothetical protein